ncbi:uncharacterized protein LOC127415868 [Myxocyprinus asiaticus]|uniref:uncharacterized protein LOC127415868 n=1 Tax=Myxocyprinus asiaticus TaxID=70543 RepID=UPI002221E853|nr:uncharacterized protein LOC127415868 [Myxocyprinus asiaticus]
MAGNDVACFSRTWECSSSHPSYDYTGCLSPSFLNCSAPPMFQDRITVFSQADNCCTLRTHLEAYKPSSLSQVSEDRNSETPKLLGFTAFNDKKNEKFSWRSNFFSGSQSSMFRPSFLSSLYLEKINEDEPYWILTRCVDAWESWENKPWLLAFAVFFVYLLRRITFRLTDRYHLIIMLYLLPLSVWKHWHEVIFKYYEIVSVIIVAVVIVALWFFSGSLTSFVVSLLCLIILCMLIDVLTAVYFVTRFW